MYKPVKLTQKTALKLIRQISSGLKVKKEAMPPDIAIFRAELGVLEIRCENDWFNNNGLIKLTIYDHLGGNFIRMYFHPETLNRDFVAEQSDKADDRREARRDWVQMIGREQAHKLVDQCWEA